MKVLFVFRNHQEGKLDPIIENQSKYLIEQGIDIHNFPLERGGLNYFKSYFHLKKHLKKNSYDLIHAHFGYTAIIAGLAHSGFTIASLMGSDLFKQNKIILFFIKIFTRFVWDKTIVKSAEMKKLVPGSMVIPNGVNVDIYHYKGKEKSKLRVAFSSKYNIIFVAANPETEVKNLNLAKQAINLLDDMNIGFYILSDISRELLPYYYSAADMMLLTSFSEGSPNVIKEAMACNCPIVSTDVGDVREIFGKLDGCFITSFNHVEVAEKIKLALEFSTTIGRTNGYNRILETGLDSSKISAKIIELYSETLLLQ